MNKKAGAFLLVFSLFSLVALGGDWEFKYKSINAKMVMYSAGLGDPSAPTAQDSKISFVVEGKAARDIFDQIGPDKKNQCGSDPGIRTRSKNDGKVECIRYSKSEYSCWFGFDLKTGESVVGSIC